MIVALAAAAFAADEPCYGHDFEQRVSTDQFWVEWDGNLIDADKAAIIGEAAEDAVAEYRAMGFAVTDAAMVIAVQEPLGLGGGTSGLTRTTMCDAVPVPRIDLYMDRWDEDVMTNITAHEVGHVAEYAYVGAYDDGVAAWLWWMEGTATWLTPHADSSWTAWGDEATPYLAHPERALHHGLGGFLDPAVSDHMYATTYVAETLTEYAGEDAVLATWEWAASVIAPSPDAFFFGDAVNGAGIDFDAYWAWHLAALPTRDITRAPYVGETHIAQVAASLPDTAESTGPEGLGIEIVQFPAGLGDKKSALFVTFDGDPEVDWHAVLVRTNGTAIVDYVAIPVTDGHGEGWVSGFYRVDAWLVVSPSTLDAVEGVATATAHPFTWSAELGDDVEPMPGVVQLSEPPETGGCDHTGGAASIAVLGLGLLVRRRR